MSSLQTNLLTEAEVDSLRWHGVPEGLPSDLVSDDGFGHLVFSVKGLQAYRFACAEFGCESRLAGLHTVDDLLEFQFDMYFEAATRSYARLKAHDDAGRTRPEMKAAVQAMLYGTVDQFNDVADATLQLQKTGANVLLLPKRKWPQ